MGQIDKLTPEQEADKNEYRERRWFTLINPIMDEEAVEKYMREAYRMCEAGEIRRFIWVDSPMQLKRICKGEIDLPPQRDRGPVYLDDDVIVDALRALDPAFVTNPWLNEWLGCWTTYCTWCSKIVQYAKDDLEKLLLLEKLSAVAGWVYAFKEVCICVRRPVTAWDVESISDGQPVLHHASRAAVRFPDGWELYAWRGTVVPKEWIMEPEKVDPSLALTWPNMEQRRALAEILGWEVVLKQLKPVVVDANPNPEIGTLVEVELPDAGRARFLRVRCPTGRDFTVSVPIEMQTAKEANAFSYNETEAEFDELEFRT